MRYAIIINPVSGEMSVDQKRSALAKAAEILGAEIHGLDTKTPEDFARCGRELADTCDVLVAAGGDGSLSDIINSVSTDETAIAYLPLGSGNAMRNALNYKGSLTDIAIRIRDGKIHQYDLIDCDEKRRAFMASLGFEGKIIRVRNKYLTQGVTGFKAYFIAVFISYLRAYRPPAAKFTIDDATHKVKKLLTLMIVKQPYYGYGVNVVPRARFDDGQIHILSISSGLFNFTYGAITALTFGNRVGQYRTGTRLLVELDRPLLLHVDGNEGWEGKVFTFKVLPKALKIKH